MVTISLKHSTSTSGTTSTGLNGPSDLAVDSAGNLYVADTSNNRVLYFPAGQQTMATKVYGQANFTTSTTGTTATTLSSPRSVALDGNGNLYVADTGNNRVLFYPAGQTTATIAYGQSTLTAGGNALAPVGLSGPYSVRVNSSGNVYVADYSNNRVLRYLAPAVNYTFSGPSGGSINTQSAPFTLTPNSLYTGTVTVTPSGGGLSVPVVLTFSNSATPQTFTITPAAAGPVTLTPSNNGSMADAAVLTYNTPPAAPSITSITPGSTQISVAFTPNATGGSSITGYSATCGSSTIAGASSPIAVTGLTNGTAYSCSVTATNMLGTSAASTASSSLAPLGPATGYTLTGPVGGLVNAVSGSFTITPNGRYTGNITITLSGGGLSTTFPLTFSNSVTPQTFTITPTSSGPVTLTPTNSGSLTDASGLSYSTPPAAPGSASATSGYRELIVSFSPNATGGSSVTSYSATCGSRTGTGTFSPVAVSGLTNGTSYTCTVTAANSIGTSEASATSASAAPSAMAALAVYGQGGNFTFNDFYNGATSADSLKNPDGVLADSSGNLYISDSNFNRVLFYQAGSTTATQVYGQPDFIQNARGTTATALATPAGSVMDASGNLYVADITNNRVLYYPSGSTIATRVYGQPDFTGNTAGVTATTMKSPTSVFLDSGGNLYVSDGGNNRVLYFPAGQTTATRVYGQVDFTHNSTGVSATTLHGPNDARLDSAGNLYVAEAGNNRVLYYPAGQTTATRVYGQPDFTHNDPGTTATTLRAPESIALDGSGNLYIADRNNCRVLFYPAGSTTATAVWGQPDFTHPYNGTAPTALNQPIWLALTGNGDLYVADYGNNRVLRFVVPAISYKLTGPSGGPINSASANFTVTPNSVYTGTVTITPSGGGLSTPITLTFNNSATPQTFTVTPPALGPGTLTPGNNGSLTDPAALTYSTSPAAPTLTSVTAGNGQITVTFTANATGGSAITGYSATCGSNTVSGSASPITVTGLMNSTGYTCTVAATNAAGTSAASGPSNSVTPTAPASGYTLTGPSGGALNVASANFTVTPNAAYTGTVTISPSGGGVTRPVTLSFSNSPAPQTFAVTPSAVGPVTLTASNNSLLTNPPALTYSTPPTAPTVSSATAGNGQISVAFTVNQTGGATITSYTAACGTSAISGASDPIVVTGLTNGTAYTCTVTAANANGASTVSAASNPVTPFATATSYNLSGPAGGRLNTASASFTVTPSAIYTGTITITPSGGGLSMATILTFTNSSAAQTFTITPGATGPVTLAATNSGALANAPSLTYSTPPAAPTISSVAAGNGQVSVGFAPNQNGGSAITSYAATCGGSTIAGSTSPIAVTGLANGTPYTCTVNGTNANGPGAPSTASNLVTPFVPASSFSFSGPAGGMTDTASGNFTIAPNALYTGTITITPSGGGLSTATAFTFTNSSAPQTLSILPTAVGPVTLSAINNGSLTNPPPLPYATQPAAPAISSVTAGNGQISVAFAPNATGGSAITGYAASCGSSSAKGGSSPIVVTALTNNTAYTCTAVAINAVGTSAASAASMGVTPFVPATTYTLTGPVGGAMNAASATFTVTPNAVYTGNINIALSGSGVSTPKTLTFTSSSAPQAFTIIPVSVGPLTVTATNSGSLINPPPLTFATPPAAPLISSAVPGNAQISVSFASNGSGGSPITGYTVNCAGFSSYGASSPITVSGLTNGVAYTCSVTATNAFGTSAALGASSLVTPVSPATTYALTGPTGGTLNSTSANFTVTPDAAFSGTVTIAISGGGISTTKSLSFVNSAAPRIFNITPVSVGPVTLRATNNSQLKDAAPLAYSTPPGPPVIGTAIAGAESATVTFTPPVNNGGSPVATYKATCAPGNLTGTGASSPLVVKGLNDGTAYTCSVTAANIVGASTASNLSSATTPGIPLPPQNVSAIAGDGQATVSFAASSTSGALPITGYSVVTSPGGSSFSTTSSPVTIRGLTDGVSYVFSVTAQNRIGSSPASISNSIVPVGPPGAPFTVSASAGNGQAIVSFSAPVQTGGRPISAYTAVSSPGGIVSSGSGSPITVTGLANGTPYTFAVVATNSIGTGLPSSSSNSVTPLARSASSLSLEDVSSFPVGVAGVEYPVQMLHAKGGTGPYTYSITSASLPSGLNLTGPQISGVPAWPGFSPFSITVSDSSGNASSASTSISINPAGPDLILSESTLSYSLAAGSQGVPAGASVTVRSSDVHQPLNYTVALSQPTPWLSVTGGGSSPGSLQIALSPAALALAAGMYQSTVTATCLSPSPCAGGTKSVAVSLSVTAALPSISVTGSILKFDSDTSHAGPMAQIAELQNLGGGNVALISATPIDSWLSVGKLPSSVSAGERRPIIVAADSSGLAPGLYTSSVMFASAAGALALPVHLQVSTNPMMTLSPSGSQFRSALGTPLGNPNGSFLITTAALAPIQWKASLVQGGEWLMLLTPQGTASAASPGKVAFSVSPSTAAGKPPQTYYGLIQITSNDVANSPVNYEVVLEALNSSALPKPEVEPAGLVFVPGTSTSRTVRIYASAADAQPFQVSSSTQDGAAWLAVNPVMGSASASSPGQVVVSVNTAGLASGTYRGAVNVAFSSDAVRTVNVTLQLSGYSGCDPTALVATQTGLANNFQQALGWPVALELKLTNGCGAAVTSSTASAWFSNGDQPIVLKPVDASSGLFSGTWVPGSSSSQVTVAASAMGSNAALASTQIVGQVIQNSPPLIAPNGIFLASSPVLGGPLAPGSIVEIYGSNLSVISESAHDGLLPFAIGGTSVSIGGLPASLLFVSPNQINAQVPLDLPLGMRYQVEIYVNGALSAPQSIDLVSALSMVQLSAVK